MLSQLASLMQVRREALARRVGDVLTGLLMSITSDELNFLVYRYLHESGALLSAAHCRAAAVAAPTKPRAAAHPAPAAARRPLTRM